MSCSEEKLDIDYSIAKPEYDLPKGEPGSLDAKINDIYQKYGTYMLYEFEESDFRQLWTQRYSNWYVPVQLANKDVVGKFIDRIQEKIFNKFEVSFIQKSFPYKIFFVDSLSSSYEKPNKDPETGNSYKYINMHYNGQNAFVVANAGSVAASWEENDWLKFDMEFNTLFTQYYYSALPVKPVDFIASAFSPMLIPNLKEDPLGEDTVNDYSCWTVGYVQGRVIVPGNPTWLSPKENQDYVDFVAFLTGRTATDLTRILNRYEMMKTRALFLVPYLTNVVGLNVVATQNINCPDDKLPVDFFDKLQ